MKPLCVTVVVDQGYQEYIPLYLYFLFKAYPDYEAIVSFEGTMYAEVADCLRLIEGMGSFEIKPLLYRYDRADPHSLMSVRWVLYDDDFTRYDNVYTGDVDMLIVRESPSLCELGVRHSDEIRLPYSNRVRGGQPRFTGLHFVRTHAYYPRVRAVMERYRERIAAGDIQLHNEEVLYRMMEESVGLPQRPGTFTVHHGIHLGVFRLDDSPLAGQRARKDYLFEKVFVRYYKGFYDAARTELCSEIRDRLSRLSYPGHIPRRYANKGPQALQQFDTAIGLCRELEEEARV